MTPFLIISAVALLPVLLAIVLGVNSVLLFLSVAVGILLEMTLVDSTNLVLSGFIKDSSSITASLILLAAPVVFTLLFLRKSSKPAAVIMQVPPLLLTGALFGYMVLARMSSEFQEQVYGGQFGPSIQQASDIVIAAAALINLLLAWQLYRHKGEGKHAKHH